MSVANWNKSPAGAQAWGPSTNNYMEGWYKTNAAGQWFFTTSNRRNGAEWWHIDRPTLYRQKQMERRP